MSTPRLLGSRLLPGVGTPARDNGPQRPYIRAASLNGRPFNKAYLTHRQLCDGGSLSFDMDSLPNFLWAVGEGDRPPSPLSSITPK